jgi:serine acetyltransferase
MTIKQLHDEIDRRIAAKQFNSLEMLKFAEEPLLAMRIGAEIGYRLVIDHLTEIIKKEDKNVR